jgi:hypothetical protein
MKGRAALAAVIVLAAGLAACSSSSSGGSAAVGSAKPSASASGTETIYGKVTYPAVAAKNPQFHLVFAGPVATTSSTALGNSARKGESFTFKTPAGDLAITFDATGAPTATLVSTTTCLAVISETVPFTVDGAKSSGKFAGAAGTGKATLRISGDLPKLSSGKCDEHQHYGMPFVPKTAVGTLTATIKLTVRK